MPIRRLKISEKIKKCTVPCCRGWPGTVHDFLLLRMEDSHLPGSLSVRGMLAYLIEGVVIPEVSSC